MEALVRKIINAQDGEEFCQRCLKEIYARYSPEHCFVAEYDLIKNVATTRVYLADGTQAANMAYELRGSPCEKVINDNMMCSFSQGIQQRFPEDVALRELNAESYIGIPLQARNGQIVGVLALLYSCHLDTSQFDNDWLLTLGFLIGNSLLQERLTNRNDKLLQQFDRSEQITDTSSWTWRVQENQFYCSQNLGRMFQLGTLQNLSFDDFFRHHVFKRDDQFQDFLDKATSDIGISRLVVRREDCIAGMQLEISCSKSFDSLGQLERVEGNIKNVTRITKLLHERTIADQLIQLSDRGVMLTDRHNRIVKVNSRVEEITGYSSEELIGKKPQIFSSDIQDKEFYAEMWHSINTLGHWSGEVWNKTKAGAIYPEKLQISVVEDMNGDVSSYLAVFEDISTTKMIESQLDRYKNKRDFTGLITRSKFIQLSDADDQQTVILIDICRFSAINTIYGEVFGNKVLRHVGKLLQEHFSDVSTSICRYGADQFAMTIPQQNTDALPEITEKLRSEIEAEFTIDKHKLKLSVNIGHSNPEQKTSNTHPLTQAYYALDEAKTKPVPSTVMYCYPLEESISRKHRLSVLLKHAIAEKRIHVEYQPIYDLDNNRVVKYEALARWVEDGESISPFEFIPIAEELGYIKDLGQLVLEIACQDIHKLKQLGHDDIVISVNRSIDELINEDPENCSIINTIHQSGLSPENIIIEVTESVPLEDKPDVQKLLDSLRAKGLKLALDDFGTGFASFSNLMKNTVDILKVDRSLIRNIDSNKNNAVLVESVNLLANQLGLDVIAEGVETEQQLQLLKSMGCRYIQGYYISKPVPFEQAVGLIK